MDSLIVLIGNKVVPCRPREVRMPVTDLCFRRLVHFSQRHEEGIQEIEYLRRRVKNDQDKHLLEVAELHQQQQILSKQHDLELERLQRQQQDAKEK